MSLLTPSEWIVAEAIADIGYTNPFLPERIELEKRALGRDFIEFQPFMQYRPDCSVHEMFPNFPSLRKRCERLLEKLRQEVIADKSATERQLQVYEDLSLYLLYTRHISAILELPVLHLGYRAETEIVTSYDDFVKDFRYYLTLPGRRLPSKFEPEVIFAGLFQIERAFSNVFNYIAGGSLAAARLRATVWQSIFTHDMRRYTRSLYRVMSDVTTLITGPSGTGKELVARALAFSSFIAFDSKNRRFVADHSKGFIGLNLSAMAPTLIESELFGHAKGAFTDAKGPRAGYLDETISQSWSTVFLDEIGELDTKIQVKLLRVLQNREFQRVGESETRQFAGKIVAATNRDLDSEMEAGRFREDLYYRLCADRIETPSLHAQLQEMPADLPNFVRFIAKHLLRELPEEVGRLTDEAVTWIAKHLGPNYAWPGNIRELEQCVRSVVIRGNYTPARRQRIVDSSPLRGFLTKVEKGELSRDELLRGYFSLVYSNCGSFRAAAKQLGTDWRTVKETIDRKLVLQFNPLNPPLAEN